MEMYTTALQKNISNLFHLFFLETEAWDVLGEVVCSLLWNASENKPFWWVWSVVGDGYVCKEISRIKR